MIVTYVDAGWPIPLYVGDGSWMQHTVLVLEADANTLSIYEPAAGTISRRTRESFCRASLDLNGWPEPWLFILPGVRPGHRFA